MRRCVCAGVQVCVCVHVGVCVCAGSALPLSLPNYRIPSTQGGARQVWLLLLLLLLLWLG